MILACDNYCVYSYKMVVLKILSLLHLLPGFFIFLWIRALFPHVYSGSIMDSWIIFEAPLIFLIFKLTKFDQWKTFQNESLTSLIFEHFLFSSIRYCRLTFNIPCPKPWINLFFKDIWFLLERMVFRDQDLDYRCSHCYWVASRPIQWAEIGIINFIPQGNFLSFSTPYSVPFLPQ